MAAYNRVVLVGRLTRDVETRTFGTGGMVAKFGLAVNAFKKDDPAMFIDCEAFNRGDKFKLADVIRDYCKKGSQILIEGRLELDQWDDKATGAKRSKHKIVVDAMQLLDAKQASSGSSTQQQEPTLEPSGYTGQSAPANQDIPFGFILAVISSAVSMFA